MGLHQSRRRNSIPEESNIPSQDFSLDNREDLLNVIYNQNETFFAPQIQPQIQINVY
jgi:hypothetical protein